MKKLPEKIALDKAIHGTRNYQGTVELKKMSRLLGLLANSEGSVNFSLQFERSAGIIGKAQVIVKTDLPLVCTISQKEFMFPVEIDSTVGFIDDLAYEDRLDEGMEVSWVEDDFINPLEIIEDELILVVPDAPFDDSNEKESNEVVIKDNKKPNPFAVLKDLKK